ncbi:MAG: FMN-binding negative transcriptional regulator [Candidatus Tectomicrobia bacterium]|uniref:FMN-binding negative transcriptional regulator n=1 Tax=Tectimicrobiota bacterium TaxID=2528274 RepID=A0A938B2D7_UNCTE|nr:FMN-binding negative transcriptional regulator [Candidatus Tectomicrobia bacterium]
MYMPKHFHEPDLATLHDLMQSYNFATVVTQHEGAPFATHTPLILAPDEGPYGTLYGHIARANPQWRAFEAGQEALIIFQGPHTYVSPSWYEEELSVPTWNYTAVHAYGIPRLVTDHAEFSTLLETLVRTHESQFPKPWPFQLPADYVHKMMRGIVGFGMQITRLEGKYKLSQNRSRTDQEHVAATLQQSADPLSRDVGLLMQQRQAARRV